MVIFVLISLMLAMGVMDLAVRAAKSWPKEDVETLQFVLGTLGFQGAILGWAAWLLRLNRLDWGIAFGCGLANTRRLVLLATGAGLAIAAAAAVLGWACGSLIDWMGYKVEAQAAVQMLQSTESLPKRLLYGGVAILVAPLAEEVLFRGILYPTVKQLGFPRLALWLTSLLFGAIHMNWMAMIPLTVVALALTWLYECTGDLRAPILAHSLFNLINFTLLLGPLGR